MHKLSIYIGWSVKHIWPRHPHSYAKVQIINKSFSEIASYVLEPAIKIFPSSRALDMYLINTYTHYIVYMFLII
jgi:hypothetical protein